MNKQELYKYIDENPSSIYLITCDGKTEPIHFFSYEGLYFECSVCIYRYEIKTEEELKKYCSELYIDPEDGFKIEKEYWIDGYLYDIDYPQCTPFLPDKIDGIKPISEKDYLLSIIPEWEKEGN